jgi:uncharacterized membrane protein YhaH (DUF805 family)
MFEYYFSLRGRITRKEFWLTAGPVQWVVLPFVLFVGYYNSGIVLLLLVVPLWVSVAACVKRSHDLGYSGWLALLPLFNPFILAFRAGRPHATRFGPNPKKKVQVHNIVSQEDREHEYMVQIVNTMETHARQSQSSGEQLQDAL